MVAARVGIPALGLEPLIEPPATIDNAAGRHHIGYRTDRTGVATLRPQGRAMAAIVQRIYLARLLGLADRNELAARYGYSVRQIVGISRGIAHTEMLAPVRARMLAVGMVLPTAKAREADRRLIVAGVLARLAERASAVVRHPNYFRDADRLQLATDLYLLSGAWWTETER